MTRNFGGKMNSVKTVFIACMLTAIVVPAYAATRCVLLNASGTTCTSNVTNAENVSDWRRSCTTNGTSTPLSGIVQCSATTAPGAAVGSLAATISTKPGKNCWARVLSPVVGMWVLVDGTRMDSASGCHKNCARLAGGDVYEWGLNVTAPSISTANLLKSVTGTATIKY